MHQPSMLSAAPPLLMAYPSPSNQSQRLQGRRPKRLALFDECGEFSRRARLKSLAGELLHGVPINLIEIETNGHPASWSNISRHKETLGIVSYQSTLLTEARLAGESDHPVAVMIEQIVRECFLPDTKSDVLLLSADNFIGDFGESAADVYKPVPAA